MAGLNLAKAIYSEATRSARKQAGIKCVFLSHQKADRDICRKIADYLMAANINVYFDEDDNDLKDALQTQNPHLVTAAICKGIRNSTHMLCVVSPNTITSRWVPFEVGYGYDQTYLGVLTLKGIPESSLPDYIKTAKVIVRGTKSLNEFIATTLVGSSLNLMERNNLIKAHSMVSHPLDSYLDWNQ